MSDSTQAVAYQGEPGAYSEAAASRPFPEATLKGFASFHEVFEAVTSGTVARAVVPIENAIFGSVHAVFDLLQSHELRIVEERWERVRHCLLALPGVTAADLREVHSHGQALGQCAVYLRERLPQATPVQAHDTAGAARQLRDSGRRDVAAIASRRAAERYGLAVLDEGIETHAGNFTRFLVVVRPDEAPPAPVEEGKTSLLFCAFPGLPEALFRCFAAFGSRGLDLLRIECRPRDGQPLHHTYFLDVRGGETSAPMQEALAELRRWADGVRVLGSYPIDG